MCRHIQQNRQGMCMMMAGIRHKEKPYREERGVMLWRQCVRKEKAARTHTTTMNTEAGGSTAHTHVSPCHAMARYACCHAYFDIFNRVENITCYALESRLRMPVTTGRVSRRGQRVGENGGGGR